jgi:protein-tyrosine phosphatase
VNSRPIVRVLFVCMGNICRSPLAQGVFEEVVRREGLEGKVEADSAGTHGYYHAGEPPDTRAQKSAAQRGIDISAQRARRLTLEDCEAFDYIVTMDEENYRTVAALCRRSDVEVRPFLDFTLGLPEKEIPDPYYGGSEGFEQVLCLVEKASEGLLQNIREQHLSCYR